jgi:hypothetical protein
MKMRIPPAFLILGTATALGAFAAATQQPTQSTLAPLPARIPYSPFKQIHVDDGCRILPDPAVPVAGKKKPRPRTDPVICHLETVLSSNHLEETIVGSELRRSKVHVNEQTYVMQNITTEPVVFVVQQFVPQGWVVDSDPQPVAMEGQVAIFQANAQPGEIVQMHVGMRLTTPLRTRVVKTSPGAAAGD